ncbi:MAG: hypothetical protein EXR23_06260 [Flavobacteriaceae bacterium]|nr:hypothetical protein [Flavobacteriaceae bacterium]PHX76956.1 MAG: hypothetical protein CK543_04570 [Flavobacteriales bacterium]
MSFCANRAKESGSAAASM